MKEKTERVLEQIDHFNGVKEFEANYILTYVMDLFIKDKLTYTSFKIFLLKSTLTDKAFNSLTPYSIEYLDYMSGNKQSFKKAYQELFDKKIFWREKDAEGNFILNRIHINYNNKRVSENGEKVNPKIYFSSSYLKAFMVSKSLTERQARFLCVILNHIQAVPKEDFKKFNKYLFFEYLKGYSYPKKIELLTETLLKLESIRCINLIEVEDYNYTIQLTNFLDQDTINKIKEVQMEKTKIKTKTKSEEPLKESVKDSEEEQKRKAIIEARIREPNIYEKELEEQRIKIEQRKMKDFQNRSKYKLDISYNPPVFDLEDEDKETLN
jgi:hypothetical protein